MPSNKLTLQEAAYLLNVSLDYLDLLLEQGTLSITDKTPPYILLSDVMAYKKQRDAERKEGLRELTQMSQEMGLYD